MDTRTTDLSRRMALFEPSRAVTEINLECLEGSNPSRPPGNVV